MASQCLVLGEIVIYRDVTVKMYEGIPVPCGPGSAHEGMIGYREAVFSRWTLSSSASTFQGAVYTSVFG